MVYNFTLLFCNNIDWLINGYFVANDNNNNDNDNYNNNNSNIQMYSSWF